MYQSNRSFNVPPGQPPEHLNFWKIFVQIPPSRGWKAVQIPPPARALGGGAGAYFTDSGWKSRLENYCLYCKNNFKTFTYLNIDINQSLTPSNTEQSLCRPLPSFQPIRHEYTIKSLSPRSPPWFINPRGISATRNMISRLVIEFPTP